MGKPLNLMLGAFATALVAVGVAAQTGTVDLPNQGNGGGSGGVEAQQAISSPPDASPSPSPEPSATPAAVVAPPPPADSAPKHNKKHGG